MFKLFVAAGIIGLLAACSSMSVYDPGTNTATVGASRSVGEGPGLSPFYGAAGF